MFKLSRMSIAIKTLALVGTVTASALAMGQQENELEEVIVVGSQIKGAAINTALPVSIISADDIDALGLDSGEELLENMAEIGINYFTEAEAFSGGVNSVRGDIGSYNLRNMGVGNTLVLLNGRRLVNAAGYQTELLGGDYVPTLSVNSNLIPTSGMKRVEVLKDGASAIYGADAVAGVINNVIDTDYEGFSFTTKLTSFDHFDADDTTFSAKFGTAFNDGDSHMTVLVDYYDRESIKATEDSRWSVGDHRKILPDDSPWKNSTAFRNLYSYQYAQLDQSGINSFTDSKGEMQILPTSDAKCAGSKALDTGYGTCLVPDTTSDNYYLNPGLYRDFRSAVDRKNIFATFNHMLSEDLELFSEVGYYKSTSLRHIEPAGTSSSAPINIGADYYYSNQLVQDGGNPLAGVGSIRLDGMRNPKYGRIVHADKETTRFLAGLRGSRGDWDWETAVLYSKATTDDLTENRISNNLLTEALADSTAAAFNIFSIDATNIERALVDVYRNDESELTLFDIKASNSEVFSLPAGPVGMLVGLEYREETYSDDRDPRLDGTIKYSAANGSEFPFVSDVLGSSPTTDSVGSKDTTSVFAEFQIPVTETIDAQLAIRHEDISDAGTTTVGKFAIGWTATEWLLMRGSMQTAFRAPNLVQVNQAQVARFGSRIDAVYKYITENNTTTAEGMDSDSKYTIQRFAVGAEGLQSEESTNSSIGFVIQPTQLEGLTITYDAWKIEKDKTIGLFGRDNHTVLDLAMLIENGTANCAAFTGNTAVLRDTDELDDGVLDLFSTAGICPVGQAYRVEDEYVNMATRTLKGQDIGIVYDFDSRLGEFSLRYSATFTDTFSQVPTGNFETIQAAQNSGAIPAYINLVGFGDLLGIDGNYDEKHSAKLLWKKGSWGGSITALKKGDFIQSSLTLNDGTEYVVPSMTTVDASLYYRFKMAGTSARVKFGVKNIEDTRAPTADRFFGFFADAHQDYGRNYNLSIKVDM